MQIRISYKELINYISSHYGKVIAIKYVNSDTITIGSTVNMVFFSKEVGVTVSLDKIEGEDLYLSYNNGMGVDMILKGALKFVKMSSYGGIVEERTGNALVVHMGHVDQIKKIFENMSLDKISFSNDGVILLASLT
ncbi:MAG: hypothetical protein E7105_00190 [Prevotella sp.]|nr:hypothetical protein [Prevotella sp.]